jgi:hypothetical protein
MTSLNKSVANFPDENTLWMYEYWQPIESSVFTQQAETGSYFPRLNLLHIFLSLSYLIWVKNYI